ncbi:hypothetical protein PHMEG_00039639, partial [Phytophthora megakarya]
KKKGCQPLAAIWYEWFTAQSRVYSSHAVKKTTLYEFLYITAYMMLFLPAGFALDDASSSFKSDVLSEPTVGKTEQCAGILKANGSSAKAAGTALKALRALHKEGKLDKHIAQFRERVEAGSIVHPSPVSALPKFILQKA